MFDPSQQDVRRFFCGVQAKTRSGQVSTRWRRWRAAGCRNIPVEEELRDAEAATDRVYDGSDGRANPFLHLAMHLSISEQCSIDQPRGIRQAVELLAARRNSLHEAHHEAMECLGQMLWDSQRSGRPPDGDAYVECVQRRATR